MWDFVEGIVNVVYSICARFGGSGIGYTAYNAACGIHRAGLLTQLFASSNAQTEVPASLIRQWGIAGRGLKYLGAKDATGLIHHLESILFDAWTAARLPRCDIFHGWNGMCLRTLRRAHQMAAITVVERASAHPDTVIRLLREEYARWGVPLRLPIWAYRRSVREIEESDYSVVPSVFAYDTMLQAGVSVHKLILIPLGVDSARFSPAHGAPPHPFRVVFAGNVSLNKGVPYLLEAWQMLNWQDAELWIVGAPASDVAHLLPRWRTIPGVRFIEHTSHLADLFRQCDVFVFPSLQEGFGLVIVEAMACGLPVVTTANVTEVPRDGQEGFIVPIRDVATLGDRMQLLRDDTGLRTSMAHAAVKRAEEFTWTVYQDRLVTVYRAKLKQRELHVKGY